MTAPIDAVAARHWTLVLDDYERVLAAQEAAIAQGFKPSIQPPSFVPPAGIPPIPHEMRTRAQALVDRTDLLIEQAQRAALAAQISDPAARGRRPLAVSPATSASALDLRA